MQTSDEWRKALVESLRRLQTTARRRGAAGYSPKDILEQLLLIARAHSKCASRNLSLQLRAALKRAVGEGLLKLRAGRYALAIADNKQRVERKEKQPRHSPRLAAMVNDSLPTKSTKVKSSNNKKKPRCTVKDRVKRKKSSRSKR